MFIIGVMGNSMGIVMSVLSPTLEFAVEFATDFNMPVIMCGGLFLNIDDIPKWLPWRSCAPVRYAFEAMLRNEYDDLHHMSHHLHDAAVDT